MGILKRITGGLRNALKSKIGKVFLAGAAMWAGGKLLGKIGQTASAAGSAAAPATGAVAETGATAAQNALNPVVAATPAVPPTPPPGGIISRAIKGVGGFVEKNPMASSMIFNAAASALGPDETELMQEQEKIRQQRWQNMEVPNSVGFGPGKGIINGGMR